MKKKILSAFVMAFCVGTSYAKSELSNDTFTHAESIPVSTVVEHQTDLDIASVATVLPEAHSLKALSDDEMSQVEGQALLSLTNKADSGQGLNFYKLGMEATVDINANIRKLQLGCGGVNSGISGKGGMCDIDIDNLSLSGLGNTREERASSSAKLTNPFLEFAIKNPDSASTREVMGFRVSAEKVAGLLTLGEENSGNPNGINSLSGYLKINDATGVAKTAARTMTYNDTNKELEGRIYTTFLALTSIPFTSNNYTFNLKEADANLKIKGQVISGTRMSTVKLSGSADIAPLGFEGPLVARVVGIPLTVNATGTIEGLKADITVDENLGFIHKLKLNNPASLSLQKTSIKWPNATEAANAGWWLAIEDSIDIGSVSPSDKVNITSDVLKQVVDPISNYLIGHPLRCPGLTALGCVITGEAPVGPVNLSGTSVNFPLSNLKLSEQTFAPNCYGSLKFC